MALPTVPEIQAGPLNSALFFQAVHPCYSQGYHRVIQVVSPAQIVKEALRGPWDLARQRTDDGHFRKRKSYMEKNKKLIFYRGEGKKRWPGFGSGGCCGVD